MLGFLTEARDMGPLRRETRRNMPMDANGMERTVGIWCSLKWIEKPCFLQTWIEKPFFLQTCLGATKVI